jgi:hypothetical protein
LVKIKVKVNGNLDIYFIAQPGFILCILAKGHFLEEPYRSYLNEALSGGKRKMNGRMNSASRL